MSDIDITSLANKLQKLELGLKRRNQEIDYGQTLQDAILNKDLFTEVEVLKSLGDVHLEKGKLSKESAEFDKAAALYAAALLRCTDTDMGQTLEHRIGYMEKLSRQLLQGYTPHFRWLSPDYWGTADSNVVRVAEICDKLEQNDGKSQGSIEQTYTEMLVAALQAGDMFLELEVLKSLGDFYLEKSRKMLDLSQFSKAAAMYNKALTRCEDPEMKQTLEHRVGYMEKTRQKLRKQPIPKEPPEAQQLGNIQGTDALQDQLKINQYKQHLKEGDSSLARADLDSAEQHFAAALKTVHVPDPTAQQYQREVEPLCKLGDVYSKRGQQTGDGGDFVKAAALYNAAIARSEDQVLNANIARAIRDVEKSFLSCILGNTYNVSQHVTEKHKKQLTDMRDQIKLEMETIDQQLDPYVHDEDDPCVKEIEAKRAQAVRHLFENIAQQRKEFISLLVDECIGLMGPPPCKYALIGLGSQATGLVTPYSDLEFAILVEEESEKCLVYFRNLTHYLHLKVVNLGETILPALGIKSLNDFYSKNPLDNWYYDSVTPRGFAFDGSMPKASKTPLGRQGTMDEPPSELICTPENMASILQNDVTLYLKEGYHLATILRNPCLIAGDQGLIDTYKTITGKILQADGGKMAQQLTQETQRENIKNYLYSKEETVTARLVDVKKKLYRFPAVAVDCLALSSGIIPTTVWETIEEMENQQVISSNNAHHLTVLTSISAELRLRTYIANGLMYYELCKYRLALGCYNEALTKHEDSLTVTEKMDIFNKLGPVYHMVGLPGHYQMSIACNELALDMYRKIHGQDAEHPHIAGIYSNLGGTCAANGDHRKALSYFEQALQMQRRIYGETTAHADIATSLNNLGGAWAHLAEHRKALGYFEEALQMYKSVHGENTTHADIALSINNMGGAWSRLDDYGKAISYYEQALQMYRSIYGQNTAHPDIAILLNNLGEAWSKLRDQWKAISYHEQALQIHKSIHGQTAIHADIAKSLNNLGVAWHLLTYYEKARRYCEQALKMYKTIYGPDTEHPDIAKTLTNLGEVWGDQGDYRKAISYHEQALRMRRSVFGQTSTHFDIALSLSKLGVAWGKLDDHGKALDYSEQTLLLSAHGPNSLNPEIALAINNMAMARYNQGDQEKATTLCQEALATAQRCPPNNATSAAILTIQNTLDMISHGLPLSSSLLQELMNLSG
ncbi:KLC1 [Branchiostoma lanceolatum]|uniref:KLC1 protein n=1 Tax=Branchiostoma lanceolatum TaxID=7740 RepID=A0A8J9W912_BRALA|nr:KLC1 [Branchiostoma lanceolatum]